MPPLDNRMQAFCHPFGDFLQYFIVFAAKERSEILVEFNRGLCDILKSLVFP